MEMKNENVHMQALHHKLDVLVQILPYKIGSETDYSFCENSPPAGLCPLLGCGFHPQTPLAPTVFSLRRPWKRQQCQSNVQLVERIVCTVARSFEFRHVVGACRRGLTDARRWKQIIWTRSFVLARPAALPFYSHCSSTTRQHQQMRWCSALDCSRLHGEWTPRSAHDWSAEHSVIRCFR